MNNTYNVEEHIWNSWSDEQKSSFVNDFEMFVSHAPLFQPDNVELVPPKTWEEISFHFAYYNTQNKGS